MLCDQPSAGALRADRGAAWRGAAGEVRLALPEADTGTYLRNHYLNIDADRLPEFHRRLEEAVRGLAEEFATDASEQTKFLNVLLTATPM